MSNQDRPEKRHGVIIPSSEPVQEERRTKTEREEDRAFEEEWNNIGVKDIEYPNRPIPRPIETITICDCGGVIENVLEDYCDNCLEIMKQW